jgi:hypothetical protein
MKRVNCSARICGANPCRETGAGGLCPPLSELFQAFIALETLRKRITRAAITAANTAAATFARNFAISASSFRGTCQQHSYPACPNPASSARFCGQSNEAIEHVEMIYLKDFSRDFILLCRSRDYLVL